MKTEIITVTPDWAKEHLELLDKAITDGKAKQRNLSPSVVDRYAADMRNGCWGLTHQGVAFDPNGILLDGQHRLHAVWKSKVAVKMMVTWGLNGEIAHDLKPIDVIDRGRPRNVACQLQMHGYGNAVIMAACAGIAAKIYLGTSKCPLTMAQTLSILEGFAGSIEEILNFTTKNNKPVQVIGPLAVYHASHPNKARAFAKAFWTLENLSKNDPPLTLHRWRNNNIEKTRGGDGQLRAVCVAANCIHAWHDDEPMENVRASDEARGWLAGLNKTAAQRIHKMLKG